MLKRSIIFIVIVTIILISLSFFQKESITENSTETLIIKGETNQYLGYLDIPKINLNLGFFDYDNPLNDVSKNIELIKTGIENTYLIAAHSGVGKIAYFNDLIFLQLKDDIYLRFKDKTNHYQVTNIRKEIKDGDITIPSSKNMLILTTCDQVEKGKQLIIEAILLSD